MDFSEIKGFGAKRIEMLAAAGFNSPADLITYFPTRYIDTENLSDLAAAEEGARVLILACTHTQPKAAYVKRNLNIVKVKFSYCGDDVTCSWFNQPFMAKNIVPERYYYITGKLKKHRTSFEITQPEMIKFTGEEPPVMVQYKPIGKVSSALISDAIKAALSAVKVLSYVPDDVAKKHGLTGINEAFKNVHFPNSLAAAQSAKRVLSAERLAYQLAAYAIIKERDGNARALEFSDNRARLEVAISALPYELTAAQKRCLNSIIDGFSSKNRVNTLLEGDVGCGKTVVAMLAMYYATLSGFQSVLMCPTEILAYQHYNTVREFLSPFGVSVALLTGSLTKRERNELAGKIARGEVQCVVGTHALLSDDISFDKLALVITDEQHRFGVAQRAKLESKAKNADSIVMSATPIPRTLALTLYGDLSKLTIDELPCQKATVTTRFVPPEKEKDMWSYVYKKAMLGEQTYVVAPRIDEDENCVGAEAVYEKYSKVFGSRIALLHGRMKEKEKNAVMSAFARGEISVLVATTVIEVGIDVKQATTMIIYDADRFGMAQMHQLRGRVGRGTLDSFCFVLSELDSPESKERIERFISCNNGFELAEYDFATRGAGDFMGYSQHGFGAFPMDHKLIMLARDVKDDMLARSDVRENIARSLGNVKYEFFSGITLN